MKKLTYILLLLPMLFISCEEVVDVGLDTGRPRLVIDAYLKWYLGTDGSQQMIRLSMTSPYYQEEVPPVSGAVVTVTDNLGNIFNFTEDGATGIYRCDNFIPQVNGTFYLTVIVDGNTYTATETMKPVPPITSVEQRNDGGFMGDDIEVRAFFIDDGTTDDFYLCRYKPDYNAIPMYEVFEDRFFNGNQMFALYSDDDLSEGDQLEIDIFGISERYYNYMNILLGVAGSNGGSPFSTPPATVRGNIVNVTNPSDYPLGFFAASQADKHVYTVE